MKAYRRVIASPTGRREAPPDDRLREAIQMTRRKLDFDHYAPRNDEGLYGFRPRNPQPSFRQFRDQS
jgi:hypothetical protein